jgi:hypothetical protein
VGPHGSATPQTTLVKLGADLVVLGKCEKILAALADGAAPCATPSLLEEIDGLIAAGAPYLYFVDESFLAQRAIEFGVQERIDLLKPEMLNLLGAVGRVSIEAGVESLTEEGRVQLDKSRRLSTDELAQRLLHARRSVTFVQANLM